MDYLDALASSTLPVKRSVLRSKEWKCFFTAKNIVEITGEGSAAANQVVANRKRAIFLTEVGPEVYSTLRNLLALAKPKDTQFTDIV